MWDDAPIVTLDLTDPNIWHFMGELLLPTFHALLNLDLMPRHVARYAFVLLLSSNCSFCLSPSTGCRVASTTVRDSHASTLALSSCTEACSDVVCQMWQPEPECVS